MICTYTLYTHNMHIYKHAYIHKADTYSGLSKGFFHIYINNSRIKEQKNKFKVIAKTEFCQLL